MKYNVILTPCNGFSDGWKLPEHVLNRMQYIAALYSSGVSRKIIVSGKWSINWDFEKIVPPTTEAGEMKKTLINFGVPAEAVIAEEESKDTISNAYFSKIRILKPQKLKRILIVCADYHLKRVKFLFEKILSNGFDLTFEGTKTPKGKDPEFLKIQNEILEKQKDFLSKMKNGDDSFLKDKLYKDVYYKIKRPTKIAKMAMGKIS